MINYWQLAHTRSCPYRKKNIGLKKFSRSRKIKFLILFLSIFQKLAEITKTDESYLKQLLNILTQRTLKARINVPVTGFHQMGQKIE